MEIQLSVNCHKILYLIVLYNNNSLLAKINFSTEVFYFIKSKGRPT